MKPRMIAIAACVAATTLALTSCGTPDSESTGAPSGASSAAESSAPASTTLLIGTTSNNQVPMDAVVAAYKEKTGIDVQLTTAGTQDYQTTLRTQLSSGTAPDVFTVWAGGGNPGAIQILEEAGYLADLSDRPWVDQVDPGTAETLRIDGKTYGLPSKLDAVGMIYNTATLEELGLSAPTTWDEVLTFCGDVKAAGKVAFGLGIADTWVTQLIPYALVASTLYKDNPEFDAGLADGSTTFAGSGWEDAFSKYMEMNTAGCFNADPLGTDVNASYELMHTGQAVGVVQVLASYAAIAAAAPEGTEFGFFLLPGDNTGVTPIPRGIGVSFAVNKDAANMQNALDFVDWLATDEANEIFFAAAPGIPAMADSPVTLTPVMATATDIIAEGPTAPMPDQRWPNAQPQNAMFEGVQQLFAGTATVEDVTASMDAAYNS